MKNYYLKYVNIICLFSPFCVTSNKTWSIKIFQMKSWDVNGLINFIPTWYYLGWLKENTILCYFSTKPTKYTDLFVCHLILDRKDNAYSLECKNGCSKENREFCNTEIHWIVLSFEANGNSNCFIFHV